MQFAQAQSCGDLDITNNTTTNIDLQWAVGTLPGCSVYYDGPHTATASTTTTVTAPNSGIMNWLGVHVTSPVNEAYPNTQLSTSCGGSGTSVNLTWTGACSIEIN